MIESHANGLVSKQTLTPTELAAIRQLVATCDQYEHLHTRLEWPMVEKRGGQLVNDFLYYRDGGALIGYLALEEGAMDESETVALVHPHYRRQGVFHRLFEAASQECRARGMQRIIFVCEQSSHSGHACAHAFNAQQELAEHEMFLANFQPRNAHTDRLSLRRATPSDVDLIVSIQEQGFDRHENDTYRRVTQRLQDPLTPFYLALLADDQKEQHLAIGSFRLDVVSSTIGIYAFCLLPSYQGHGYGRQMLEFAIAAARADFPTIDLHHIFLEVDVTNTRAFNLYTSCGFAIRTTYTYYVLPLL
jgi:ribosomal protein S18 acetylase RimI-like enzyme